MARAQVAVQRGFEVWLIRDVQPGSPKHEYTVIKFEVSLAVGSLMERLKRTFIVRFAMAYGESQAGNYAAGLAFNAFMTMFPLMLGILALIGLVLRDPRVQAELELVLLNSFPADAHDQLEGTLTSVRHYSGLLGALAILGLIWTGTGLFAALEFALDNMFGARPRNFLRQRLMGLAMIGVFLVAILAAVALNALAAFLPTARFVGPVVGVLVLTGLMLAIYRVVPNRTSNLAELWPGALLAAVLTELVTLAFPLFTKLMNGFNTYGAVLALFFLLATWLYFVSQAILLGAVLNRMLLGKPGAGGILSEPPPIETQGSRAIERHSAVENP
jgi:membrane protein